MDGSFRLLLNIGEAEEGDGRRVEYCDLGNKTGEAGWIETVAERQENGFLETETEESSERGDFSGSWGEDLKLLMRARARTSDYMIVVRHSWLRRGHADTPP